MFRIRNILLGLVLACAITLVILFMQGSSEVFIYNRF